MKTTKIRLTSIIALTLVAAFLFAGCGSAAKLTEYDFGTDKVPSVNAVIGEERRVSGVSTGIENGTRYRQYTYQTETMVDDLWAYYSHLSELGWIVLKDFNLADGNGEMQLGIESADVGKILTISIDFTPRRYVIRINKMDGALNTPDSGNQTPSQPGNSGNNQTPSSNNNGASDMGSLTKDIFDMISGDSYRMVINIYFDNEEVLAEIFVKNGMIAEHMVVGGMETRFIYKGGKIYTVLYDFEMVIVEDATPNDNAGYEIRPENMVYIGEGSGDFRGKTYKYDEYRGEDGTQMFYYVDGGVLKGIRTISGSDITEVEILTLDNNVPDSAFDFPSNFEIGEG